MLKIWQNVAPQPLLHSRAGNDCAATPQRPSSRKDVRDLTRFSHSERKRMPLWRSRGEIERARHRDDKFQYRAGCSVWRSRFASGVRSGNSVCGLLQGTASLPRSGELASRSTLMREIRAKSSHCVRNDTENDRYAFSALQHSLDVGEKTGGALLVCLKDFVGRLRGKLRATGPAQNKICWRDSDLVEKVRSDGLELVLVGIRV
jgi:hypothetical protein